MTRRPLMILAAAGAALSIAACQPAAETKTEAPASDSAMAPASSSAMAPASDGAMAPAAPASGAMAAGTDAEPKPSNAQPH